MTDILQKHVQAMDRIAAMNKVIEFKDIAGKININKNGPKVSYVTPVKVQGTTSECYGIPINKDQREEQERKYGRSSTVDDEFVLFDGQTLDFTRKEHQRIWEWLKYTEILAPTRDLCLQVAGAQYYIYQPQEISREVVSITELKMEALQFVKTQDISSNRSLARMFGHKLEDSDELEIKEILYTIAENEPNRILEAKNDVSFEAKVLMNKGIDAGYIREFNGQWEVLWSDIKSNILPSKDIIVSWLMSRDNIEKVESLRMRINKDYNGDRLYNQELYKNSSNTSNHISHDPRDSYDPYQDLDLDSIAPAVEEKVEEVPKPKRARSTKASIKKAEEVTEKISEEIKEGEEVKKASSRRGRPKTKVVK